MPPLDEDPRMIEGEEMTAEMRALDAQVVRLLERKPRVEIPEGFAARVARQASAMRVPVPVRVPHFGSTAVAICTVLTAMAMLLLAPRTVGHDTFWMALQWMLCGQFCALTAWLALSRPETE